MELEFLLVPEGFGNNLVTQVREDSCIVGGTMKYNSADHYMRNHRKDDVVLPPGTQIVIYVLVVEG